VRSFAAKVKNLSVMSEPILTNSEIASRPMGLGLARLRLLLALSRTPHGLLDLAAPALAALLWRGGFPPVGVMALGLLTVFAGYTAVYALNDVVDYRVDRQKLLLERGAGEGRRGHYLDAVWLRHPLAAGRLSYLEALLWTGAWALVALLGAYLLNPVCALIFLVGCLLETAYCLLLRVSQLRWLLAGVVKGLGAMAAVFAVDPRPSPRFLAVLFLWLFFWELGGQNIPADWHDLERDRSLRAKTIPVVYGLEKARAMVLLSLGLSLAFSLAMVRLSPARFSVFQQMVVLAEGVFLLLWPAWRMFRGGSGSRAEALFNRASYYPLAVLAVVLIGLLH
jgi:4-hydroxybenzoate polyprenyltransferase